MGFEMSSNEQSGEYWLKRAKQKVDSFLSELDSDLTVTIEGRDIFPDRGSSYHAPVLLFEHRTRPEIRWTMNVETNEGYIENKLEEVVRRVYKEQLDENEL